jgi:hypothetical protein
VDSHAANLEALRFQIGFGEREQRGSLVQCPCFAQIGCQVCGGADSVKGDEILICTGCEGEGSCHLQCLYPPLTSIPDGDWYCPDCEHDAGEDIFSTPEALPSCS